MLLIKLFLYLSVEFKNSKKMNLEFQKGVKQIWSETPAVGKVILVVMELVVIACGVVALIKGIGQF